MLKIKKMIIGTMLLVITVSLSGCDPIGGIGDFFETLFSANVMIIRGIKTISGEGEVLTIQPGTTIKFKEETFRNIGGELLFKDGAKFVCQGTAEEPIVFETVGNVGGGITLEETSSNDSIIKYCITHENNTFLEGLIINVNNSTTIEENKLTYISIRLKGNTCSPLIQNNTLSSDGQSSVIVSNGGEDAYTTSPIIKYCVIDNPSNQTLSATGIYFYKGETPIIEYNNITDFDGEAIIHASREHISYTINNNYVADCNEKTGVDSTGEQCRNVIYDSYSDIPISEAGAGW